MLLFQKPISKFQTSISTFRRYQRFFGNHDIEYGYVDIEVTVFDTEKNFNILVFDINVNVDIGGGKVPDAWPWHHDHYHHDNTAVKSEISQVLGTLGIYK